MRRIDAIRARVEAATPGHHGYYEKGDPKVAAGVYAADGPSPAPRKLVAVCQATADADLFAHARADLRSLLAVADAWLLEHAHCAMSEPVGADECDPAVCPEIGICRAITPLLADVPDSAPAPQGGE